VILQHSSFSARGEIRTKRWHALQVKPTSFSACLPCSQVNDWCAKGPGLSHSTAAISDHAACMANKLDELLKGNVLHCSEVGVLLDTLLSHDAYHLLTSC